LRGRIPGLGMKYMKSGSSVSGPDCNTPN
ncbi:hypothetical protein A2U01_0112965, partial [Trifolium medium]|nr:hypothetical protein [Trifolium medium]